MILRKWDYRTHTYKPYEIPDNWKPSVYESDMEAIVDCPHCGRRLFYGDGYTSLEIHTNGGMGYTVCGDCYKKEWNRRITD